MTYCYRCDKDNVTGFHRCFTVFCTSTTKPYKNRKDWLKKSIVGRLLKRIKGHPELSQWVHGDKDIPERLYHGHCQRSMGAWSWSLKLSNVGSAWPMTECLKAKEWIIFYSHGSAEIIIEQSCTGN